MVKLGTVAPAFELMDVVTGKAVGRDDVFASGLRRCAGGCGELRRRLDAMGCW